MPAKAAHDKKEAEKAPATDDTPKQIKETVYLKPVDECDEECIKKFIPDFSKVSMLSQPYHRVTQATVLSLCCPLVQSARSSYKANWGIFGHRKDRQLK